MRTTRTTLTIVIPDVTAVTTAMKVNWVLALAFVLIASLVVVLVALLRCRCHSKESGSLRPDSVTDTTCSDVALAADINYQQHSYQNDGEDADGVIEVDPFESVASVLEDCSRGVNAASTPLTDYASALRIIGEDTKYGTTPDNNAHATPTDPRTLSIRRYLLLGFNARLHVRNCFT